MPVEAVQQCSCSLHHWSFFLTATLQGPRKVEWSVRVQRYAGGPIAPMVVGVVDFE